MQSELIPSVIVTLKLYHIAYITHLTYMSRLHDRRMGLSWLEDDRKPRSQLKGEQPYDLILCLQVNRDKSRLEKLKYFPAIVVKCAKTIPWLFGLFVIFYFQFMWVRPLKPVKLIQVCTLLYYIVSILNTITNGFPIRYDLYLLTFLESDWQNMFTLFFINFVSIKFLMFYSKIHLVMFCFKILILKYI